MASIHGLLTEYVQQKHLPYKLHAPSPTERGETDVMQRINKFCLDAGVPLTIKVGRFTLNNIVGVNKIHGTPKADVALVQWDGKELKNVFYLSHKMGSQAKDFQQYSGISETADGKKPGSISKDKTVIAFLRAIAQPGIYAKITKGKERFHMTIKDAALIGKAVYGPEYGSTKKSEDNIDAIAQGTPTLTKNGKNAATLTFSAGMHFSGDTAPFMRDPYRAVVGCTFRAGRQFTVDGQPHRDIRVFIIPLVVLGSKSQEL
jgi:hypothetical protein